MAILEVHEFPDPLLKEVSHPVEAVDERIRCLIDDMAETMYNAPGVGLAAPQVGELLRVIVIDVGWTDGNKNLTAIVNPEIVEREGTITWTEGCLSVPGFEAEVERSRRVRVEGLGRDGEPVRFDAEDLFSVALQHEIDHLDGILFIDRLSWLKRKLFEGKWRKGRTTEGGARSQL